MSQYCFLTLPTNFILIYQFDKANNLIDRFLNDCLG